MTARGSNSQYILGCGASPTSYTPQTALSSPLLYQMEFSSSRHPAIDNRELIHHTICNRNSAVGATRSIPCNGGEPPSMCCLLRCKLDSHANAVPHMNTWIERTYQHLHHGRVVMSLTLPRLVNQRIHHLPFLFLTSRTRTAPDSDDNSVGALRDTALLVLTIRRPRYI